MPVYLPGDRPNRTAAAVLSSFRFAAYRWLWLSNLPGGGAPFRQLRVDETGNFELTQ